MLSPKAQMAIIASPDIIRGSLCRGGDISIL